MKNERNEIIHHNNSNDRYLNNHNNYNSNNESYDKNENNKSYDKNESQDSHLQSDSNLGSNSVLLSNPYEFLCLDFTVDLDVASDRNGECGIITRNSKINKNEFVNMIIEMMAQEMKFFFVLFYLSNLISQLDTTLKVAQYLNMHSLFYCCLYLYLIFFVSLLIIRITVCPFD